MLKPEESYGDGIMIIGLNQEQRQIISPALIQTLELVMLPSLELKEKLEEEAKANPAIQLEKKKIESKKTQLRQKNVSNFDSQAFLENLSIYDFSLYKYMMEQVNDQDFSEKDKRIAEIVLSSLNEKGFLQQADSKGVERQLSVESFLTGTDITVEEFEKVRRKIQKLPTICRNI
jgi:DNA-directed RNA polymerase specialized sigma54-like protein